MMGVKHIWTAKEIEFIKQNFQTQTNRELANGLGLSLTLVRMKCYELGLKRMELEYWTNVQVKWLQILYPFIGDHELAMMFDEAYPKNKGWTLKHIEKKRKYLGLKRTPEQIAAIKVRNGLAGCWRLGSKHTWQTRGVAPEGEIRFWCRPKSQKQYPVIKSGGRFVHWAPFSWEQRHGKIAKGMNVIFKDGDPYNLSIDNLELITDAEMARRNSVTASTGLSDNYVAGILSHRDPELRKEIRVDTSLLNLKRKQLQLNRLINEQATN